MVGGFVSTNFTHPPTISKFFSLSFGTNENYLSQYYTILHAFWPNVTIFTVVYCYFEEKVQHLTNVTYVYL